MIKLILKVNRKIELGIVEENQHHLYKACKRPAAATLW